VTRAHCSDQLHRVISRVSVLFTAPQRLCTEATLQEEMMSTERSMIPNVLETLVTSLSAFDEVKSVILFGSRACGDADPRSDVDLAISAPQINHRRWLNMKLLAEEAPTLLSITLGETGRQSFRIARTSF